MVGTTRPESSENKFLRIIFGFSQIYSFSTSESEFHSIEDSLKATFLRYDTPLSTILCIAKQFDSSELWLVRNRLGHRAQIHLCQNRNYSLTTALTPKTIPPRPTQNHDVVHTPKSSLLRLELFSLSYSLQSSLGLCCTSKMECSGSLAVTQVQKLGEMVAIMSPCSDLGFRMRVISASPARSITLLKTVSFRNLISLEVMKPSAYAFGRRMVRRPAFDQANER